MEIVYDETNTSRYIPGISYTAGSNSLHGDEYHDYKNIDEKEAVYSSITDSPFIPSGQSQGDLSIYFMNRNTEANPDFTPGSSIQGAIQGYVYGDTMTMILMGGVSLESNTFRISMGGLGNVEGQVDTIGNGAAPSYVSYVSNPTLLGQFITWYNGQNGDGQDLEAATFLGQNPSGKH